MLRLELTYNCADMFAVIGRGLFDQVAPSRFGNLGKAFFTLFQLITLDDWFYMYSDVVSKNPGNNSQNQLPTSFHIHSNISFKHPDHISGDHTGWLV